VIGPRRARRLTVLLVAAAAFAVLFAAQPAAALPPIKHVFVIVLENESVSTAFGAGSAAPFLAGDLVREGAFVPGYTGIGHASLDNYIAMISGQAPNPTTQADCPTFTDVTPGTPAADGQVVGAGCVYPAGVQTLPDQLRAAGFSWRGYMDGMGADPTREAAACAHPALGAPDLTEAATATDQYATRHDPFVYFHSIIDDQAGCNAHVVPLSSLAGDLTSLATTPNFTFITPNLCNDGHDASCANGGPGGLPAANAFLKTVVPELQASAAFKQDGLIAVIFDEGVGDSSACCAELPGPNTLMPGGNGPGGGVTGAVLLSPFITPGTVTQTPYNHYSLLRSIEDLFGLPHLGFAAQAALAPLGSDVFGAPQTPAPTPSPTPTPKAPSPPTRPAACRAAPSGHAIGAVTIRRHGSSATLTFTPRRDAQLTSQVRPTHGRARVPRHSRLRACRAFSLALPKGHGTVRLTAQIGRSRQTKSVRY
jgi:hypothetical protein